MNQIPQRLKKEPLIEAIWQVQFEPEAGMAVSDLLPGILFAALRDQYPHLQLQRLPTAAIPEQVMQLDPNLRYAAKYRMLVPHAPFLFQVGDRIITLNCRPYYGWSAFKNEILSLLRAVKDSHLVPLPLRHSLRYIDFLTLEPAPSLSFLQLSLKLGGLETQWRPLQMRVEILDSSCTHVVQIATPAQVAFPEGVKEGAIIDLETSATERVHDWDSIDRQMDDIHTCSKRLFFQRILTQEAIAQMEPEY